jgi:hypothetical protein
MAECRSCRAEIPEGSRENCSTLKAYTSVVGLGVRPRTLRPVLIVCYGGVGRVHIRSGLNRKLNPLEADGSSVEFYVKYVKRFFYPVGLMRDAGKHQDVRVRTIVKRERNEFHVLLLDAGTEGIVERRPA